LSELILHQYEISPFSEKVRRILAYKKLPWRAVRAPAVMPKPDVVALTGGYRKIPILQIGNHVYCDTSLIARVLEQRAPAPTLYPTPLAQSLAEWFDGTVFETLMPLVGRPTRFDDIFRLLTQDEMSKMGADRLAMRDDSRRKPLGYRVAKAHLGVYLDRLDAAVARQPFVLGPEPCIADFSAFHLTWFLEKIAPEPLAPFAYLAPWMERIASLEGEAPVPMDAEEALRVSREAPPAWEAGEPFVEPGGLSQGTQVTVRAADYGTDPVAGELVHGALNEVVLRREDPRAGVVYVHFPRIGYELSAS
jgi:glutathione S-transferase